MNRLKNSDSKGALNGIHVKFDPEVVLNSTESKLKHYKQV